MRVLPILILGVLGSRPLSYPIPIESLTKCDKPSSYLCRPKRHYDRDELQYIEKLHIRDPMFYDVFTKAELFKWFKPQGRKPIPFYIWYGANRIQETALQSPSYFMDVWASFYNDALQSPWRVPISDKAVIQFFTGPIYAKEADLVRPKLSHVKEYAEEVFETDAFHVANGSNFFYIASSYWPVYRSSQDSISFFRWVRWNLKPSWALRNRDPFVDLITPFHYGSFPTLSSCFILTNYSPLEASRSLTAWPNGVLESYQYPLGRWQQMLNNRKLRWIFNGQIDKRPAYNDRRQLLLHDVSTLCTLGAVISRKGHGPEPLPSCPEQHTITGDPPTKCQCAEYRQTALEETLLAGLFDFHIRGDDFYSARIADILGMGGVPIVVDHNMTLGTTGQCHVPVKDIAIWIDYKDWMKDPVKATLKALYQKSHKEMEKLVRLLEYYRGSLIGGIYGDTRVVEDRLSHMVLRCLSEDVLQRMNFSKSDMVCDFEDSMNTHAWVSVSDVDDEPPWQRTFLEL
eukprot:Blabericola_migrator_1__5782@NODE_292_length_10275_cov_168_705525_g240_i0_p2_GENE_NODE_292_length_10275_cov_168_705525_g240_i0NODE_292_length_10275_cov_168_705525_g240_i0_p2_ORF_typecomplete_len514_score73_16Exostosin/PF03016_15/0_00011_NODE_292_length_10275_cov_168_705525_g240_i025994140